MMENKCRTSPESLMERGNLLFDLLSQSCDDYLFMCDMKVGSFKVSQKLVDEFALPGQLLDDFPKYWTSLIHHDDVHLFTISFNDLVNGLTDDHNVEYRVTNRQGEIVWIRCRGRVICNEHHQVEFFAGLITKLGKKSTVDNTTGLLNKYQFELDIKAMFEEDDKADGVMMMLGLDNFKNINEAYNRLFGDAVLKYTAKKIEALIPKKAKLYRLDGDEFAILYRGVKQEAAIEIFESIKRFASVQREINQQKYFCTISAGIVSFPQDGVSYLSLHKHAETALELAKRNGKNGINIFSKDAYSALVGSFSMLEDLRKSVDNDFDGFELYFQPQVNSDNRTLKGAEALLRWHSPASGIVSPVVFIPLLEESNLIIPVGKWVIKEALKNCKEWQAVFPEFQISINISYIQLKDDTFRFYVEDCIGEYQVKPETVILELTESCIVSNLDFLNCEFDFFRERGINIAMDDFGTGCSSLSLLKNLSTDIVKIDREFVKEIRESKFDQDLIALTIELCHSIGLKVCIEGTEIKEEYHVIKSFHSDSIQGFLFGYPENKENFTKKFILNRENLNVKV